MESSVNKVTLIGRLGRDPEVKVIPNGGKFVNLSVATNDRWRDRESGQWKERTEWHRVTIDGGENGGNTGAATFAEKYLKSGSLVRVEGKLRTRKWTDSNGQERQTTEILVNRRGELASMDFGGKRDDRDEEAVGNV